jgi:hypothetical protein
MIAGQVARYCDGVAFEVSDERSILHRRDALFCLISGA